MNKKKTYRISIVIVILFGMSLFYIGTDRFTAFTVESARIHELKKQQPQFPEVSLQDSQGRTYPFTEFEDRYVFITFFYTACTTVCPELERNMGEVYDAIPSEYMENDITFLSISFDSEHDTPETLAKYRQYFHSDGETWRMARVIDPDELKTLLQSFGVVVIPDGHGHFAHNSAFYLVNKHGHLVDVMDYKKVDEAIHQVMETLTQEREVN